MGKEEKKRCKTCVSERGCPMLRDIAEVLWKHKSAITFTKDLTEGIANSCKLYIPNFLIDVKDDINAACEICGKQPDLPGIESSGVIMCSDCYVARRSESKDKKYYFVAWVTKNNSFCPPKFDIHSNVIDMFPLEWQRHSDIVVILNWIEVTKDEYDLYCKLHRE